MTAPKRENTEAISPVFGVIFCVIDKRPVVRVCDAPSIHAPASTVVIRDRSGLCRMEMTCDSRSATIKGVIPGGVDTPLKAVLYYNVKPKAREE